MGSVQWTTEQKRCTFFHIACCGFVLIEMFVIFEGAFGLWSAVHVCLRSRELLPGFHNHYGLCQTEEAGRWWDVEQVPRLHCSAPYPCSGFSVTCHQGKTRKCYSMKLNKSLYFDNGNRYLSCLSLLYLVMKCNVLPESSRFKTTDCVAN